MLIVSFFGWWYGRGYKEYLVKFGNHMKDLADFFSIRLLITNLFAPFRQISAQRQRNISLEARMREWVDLLISRLIGATVRFVILIAGTIVLVFRAVVGLIFGILWPLMPLLLVYTVMLFSRGVVF